MIHKQNVFNRWRLPDKSVQYAYIAGCLDSDGSFCIKKKYSKDAKNPSYTELVLIKQVTPQVPFLIKSLFGGNIYKYKPPFENSKLLFSYTASNKIAVRICKKVYPFIQIKRKQIECLFEIRRIKTQKSAKESITSKFLEEHPNWDKDLELITFKEARKIMGYTHRGSITQAIENGLLLALPYDYKGVAKRRVPKLLCEILVKNKGRDGSWITPKRVLNRLEWLYNKVKKFNKIGINGTPVYHRTGCFKPKERRCESANS